MSGRAPSIPNNVKKTIQNIREITGNHSDEEIYAMLRECSMDPNETTQKLLLQDTFHEVKRRKDRKKEVNRETVDPKARSGPSGRGGRGGRANYSSRYAAQDGRNSASGKENGISQGFDKAGSISGLAVVSEAKSKAPGSSVTVMANGPVGVVSGVSDAKGAHISEVVLGDGTKLPDISSQRQSHSDAIRKFNVASGARDSHPNGLVTLSIISSSTPDSVVVPSVGSCVPAAADVVKHDEARQCSLVEPIPNVLAVHKLNASKMGGKSQGAGKNQAAETSQPSVMTHGGSFSSRPSSNYGSRSQQSVGSHKGPSKEWKPKPTNSIAVQFPKTVLPAGGSTISIETSAQTRPVQSTDFLQEASDKLQKDLEGLHVRDAQHVIIPDHIHVPEAVRTGLSFGSFDASFAIKSNRDCELEKQKSTQYVSEVLREVEGALNEQALSQNTSAPVEDAGCIDNSESPKDVAEHLSSENVSIPFTSAPDINDSKKEITNGSQLSSAHSSASYSFGVMPPMLGNPLGVLEGSEAQARDISRAPGFVVQPPMDPSNFYAQFYRSGVDSDGRVSPFPAAGVATKYSGNVAVLSSQTPVSSPEGGNSLVLSTAAPTPLVTQAAGILPSSIAVTQQPMPLFRQPHGVHLPHYPPNYIPYGHYISQFYVPPHAMHPFLGNSAFPQQAQAGSVYPGPPTAAAAAAVKFPLSQYKPGSNNGNSTHMAVGGSYGPYGTSPAGYNPGSAATVGNSTANEDLAASQFKDTSVYITGQQSEGSGVWIPAPGRDMSSLPANSFYNLPPQGQHVTFAPTQAGQGTFASIYHPAQTVAGASVHPLLQQPQTMPGAVDMVGATASLYQPPQHGQMNWPNNY